MTSLSAFSEFKLTKNQMTNLVGGQEQPVWLDCRTANGGSYSLPYLPTAQTLGEAIDAYNDSAVSAMQIVGCEDPS